ncbi:MAG: hypothetical protein VR73_06330 [Gammaproteobacteria bacterium BRH_c0]|nr:MAG: hypothetical protein VR73_06330 [Gammaproteobacteria bacterium BRH_c0]
MRKTPHPLFAILLAPCLLLPLAVSADGIVVDKIYHPYVEPLEQELEWRMVWQDSQPGRDDREQLQRFAYGRAFGERWFGEAYIVTEQSANSSQEVEAVELEVLHQLTEQGEYWADWGMVVELEKYIGADIWELGTGILAEKELGQWSVTGNVMVSQEWGSDIDDEVESRLGLQARYRYSPFFEPALEFHSGEDTRALGPAMMGSIKLGIRRNLRWELGLLFGLDHASPDQTVRAGVEYEF